MLILAKLLNMKIVETQSYKKSVSIRKSLEVSSNPKPESWKRASVSFQKELSPAQMIDYIKRCQKSPNLHQDYMDHINTFGKFVLKRVRLHNINTELEHLDEQKVEQYKKMDTSTSPPIVLGNGHILDGYHRATVAKALGMSDIEAYVGIPKDVASSR